MRIMHKAAWMALLLVVSACQADLQHGLDEREANRIVVVLEQQGIAAEKAAGQGADDWAVSVASADLSRAWQILEANGLPQRPVVGYAEIMDSSSLIPSAGEERLRLERATAGELERSLMAMPGIVDARVHLVLANTERFPSVEAEPQAGRASVLLVYNASPDGIVPIDTDAVRRLVAGGVADLDPSHVEVVALPRNAAMAPNGPPAVAVVSVGPFQVAAASADGLKLALGGLSLLVVFLSGGVALLVIRRRREQQSGRAR